jgi:hypothetical protein
MSIIKSLPTLEPTSSRRASLGLALLAGAAILTLEPNVAQAQFWGGYDSGWGAPERTWGAPRYQDEDVLRPGEIVDLLRRRGWSILSPPSMSGRHYVANVRNGFGQRLFVVLDAYDGRILDARQIEERPNTNELAAIPGDHPATGRPDEVIRPGALSPVPATPAPKPYHAPTQAKRSVAPVRSSPLEPTNEKEGPVAVAKPTSAPAAVKHVVPAPATPEANSTSSPAVSPTTPSPVQGAAPVVRQVYPAAAGTPAQPSALAPQAAEASPSATASQAPSRSAPAAPAKPTLPADAGFE